MAKSIAISSLNDLRLFGINTLTGEADRLGMRILCDLSEAGIALVESYLGHTVKITHGSNMNSMVGDDASVASIMLSRDTLWDLAQYALFTVARVKAIVTSESGTLLGIDADSLAKYRQAGFRNIRINLMHPDSSAPYGDRNVHAFTGRVI